MIRFSPGTTYAQWLARRLPSSTGPLPERLARWLGCDPDDDLIRRFEWAGLLSERPLPMREASSLDLLTERLGRLLTFHCLWGSAWLPRCQVLIDSALQ